jgi:ABC-type transport system substrate-binding protein
MDRKAPGYLKNAGYPAYDLKKAKQLVARAKATAGGKFDVVLGTTIDAENSAEAQLVKEMLDAAGINASIAQYDQATLINKALAGDIDVLVWRNLHGGFSDSSATDTYPWWSNFTTPSGGKNLINFARYDDAKVQADLDQSRAATNVADAKKAATAFNRDFAAENYITPMWWDQWTIGYQKALHYDLPPLPDGGGKPQFAGGRIPVLGLSKSG